MLNIGTTEGGVSEAEGFVLTPIGGGGEGIFTQMAQEEEGNGAEVKNGMDSAGLRVML